MLTAILAVTLSAPDLDAAQAAYVEHLHYHVVDQGMVTAEFAAAWDAPRTLGRRYVLLQSASGAQTYLRIVQSPAYAGFAAMKTLGWNSNEILVQDVDALALKLRHSPFRILGEPHALSVSSNVRAMQVIGPAGELNYLTSIPPGGGTFIKTSAQSFVDRTFIVVLGGSAVQPLREFYHEQLGLDVTPAYASSVSVLGAAWNMPPDWQAQMALAQISPAYLVELDQYPAAATARPQRPGDLPAGMAMVSFATTDLHGIKAPWVVRPARRAGAPYYGREAGVIRGPAGELIELVSDK